MKYRDSDLDEITATAEKWLRRCNGKPKDGIPVSRADLRAVLAVSADVHLAAQGRIAWKSAIHTFTAEPILAEPPVLPS